MKLLILGANGKIGRVLCERALQRGHNVTAFVYGPPPPDSESTDDITYVQGDATDSESVERAMPQHDAVISVLGHSRSTPAEMQSDAMRVVTDSMKQHGVKRIVSLTGAGVFASGDSPTLLDRFFVSALMLLDPKRIQDGIKHIEVLKSSQTDWAVLRTPKHRNARHAKPYHLEPRLKGASLSVARLNIAEALLDLAEAKTLSARQPVLYR